MNAPRLLAASIASLAALLFGIHTALAGSATWLSTGTNGDWHNPANWNPATVPNGPADIATFGLSDAGVPSATASANTEIAGIVFNPGAKAFQINSGATFTISGAGITNNSAALQSFSAFGASGVFRFENSATAGNSNVLVQAGSGSMVFFTGSATGGTARLGAGSTGAVDISGLTTAGMTAGSISDDGSGASFFRLGSKTLTVGGANLDSTVSGVIADGGTAGGVGGSIVKVGTGTMTYAGSAANTYTGTTFVNEGSLVLNKTNFMEAIRGPLVVGDGLGASGSAVLRVMGFTSIHDSQPVTVNSDGSFVLRDNHMETVGPVTVNKGSILLPSPSELHVQGPLAMTGGMTGGSFGPSGTIWLLDSAIQATSDSSGAAATVSAAVQLANAFTYTFTVSDGPGATDLLISGNIFDSAPASIVKAGGGVMVLSGNNEYRGSTTLTAGTLSISSDANLGAPPASPTANHLVFDGGTLRATASFDLNANRKITLNAGGGTVEVTAGNFFSAFDTISGAGGLTKTGPGTLMLFGSGANTYGGTTTVKEGLLDLITQAFAGPLVIGDGIGVANSAAVRFANISQLSDATSVTVFSDGKVDSVQNNGIGALTLTGGNVQIAVGTMLTVNGSLAMTGGRIAGSTMNGGTATLLGAVTASSDAGGLASTISSPVNLGGATRSFTVNDGPGAVDLNMTQTISNGGITKTGAGTLALGAFNTYGGPTTVVAGKLILTGSINGSTTVVANGATLQGTGATGPLTINSGGSLEPGLSVGTLTTGDLTLNAGSTVAFELAVANVAGSGVNDLIAVNGSLMFGGTVAITTLPGFGPGAYPLFTYTNTATNLGLAFESSFLAAHPGSTITLDSVNKRVVANIAAATLLQADFDENGVVNGADLTKWEIGFGTVGSATHMQGDADADHDVDGRDFLIWQRQLGGGSAASSSTAVPEPPTLILLFLAVMSIRRRPRSRLQVFAISSFSATVACLASGSLAHGVNISVDYSYDLPTNGGTGFFASTPAAVAAVNAAAADLSAALGPSLSAVPTDVFTGVNGGATATINTFLDFIHPCMNTQVVIENYTPVATDAFTVYAGGRSLFPGIAAEAGNARVQYLTAAVTGPAADQAGAIAAAKSAADASLRREGGGDPGPIYNRAQLGSDQPAVGAFAGRASFDIDTNNDGVNDSPETLAAFWHYDHTTPVAAGKFDFYTVALHEIMHTLGIGLSSAETWRQMHTGDTWNGAHAHALNGGSGTNLLSIDQIHIAETFISTRITDGAPQASVITPTSGGPGIRRFLTAIDLAFLQDIGYALAPSFSAADFNEDGFVDQADLASWTTGFGTASGAAHMQGDADGDSDVDGRDFLVWQRQVGSGPTAPGSNSIPEPATAWLAIAACVLIFSGSRTRTSLPGRALS